MSVVDLNSKQPFQQPLQCTTSPIHDPSIGNFSPSINFPKTLGSPFINCGSLVVTSPISLDKTPQGAQSRPNYEEKIGYSSYTSIMSPHPKSLTSVSQPTKAFGGSIVIETPINNRSKKGLASLGSFNDVLYDRIDEFLDKEGLDITEATTYVSNFMQIIKLKVVESSGSLESVGRNTTQLNCLRSQSASTTNLNMDVRTSKLFQRRVSHSQEPSPRIAFRNNAYSDDNFVSEESKDNVKQLHTLVGLKGKEKLSPSFKSKLRTLLSVDSCDMDSEAMGVSPSRRAELSPVSIYSGGAFIQSLEKLSPELPPHTSLKFIPNHLEGTKTPLSRSRAALSPTFQKRSLRKGMSLCQNSDNLLTKIY